MIIQIEARRSPIHVNTGVHIQRHLYKLRHLGDVLTGYCPIPPKTRLASFTVMVEEST